MAKSNRPVSVASRTAANDFRGGAIRRTMLPWGSDASGSLQVLP
ncbi:hypothetical protein [Desulfitobacterium sp. AusDCA]